MRQQPAAHGHATHGGRLLLAIVAVGLLVAGCSKGSSETAATETTINKADLKPMTVADLKAAMPDETDIGAGFHRDQSKEGGDDNPGFAATADCKRFLNGGGEKIADERVFTDQDKTDLELDASVTTEEIADLERDAAACKKVTFSYQGTKGVLRTTVIPADGFGANARAVEVEFAISAPKAEAKTLKGYAIIAKQGNVGFIVVALASADQLNVRMTDGSAVEKAAHLFDTNIAKAQA
jgi:hypothetical protein